MNNPTTPTLDVDFRVNAELSPTGKLTTRIAHLPPKKCLRFYVITGPDGEVLAFCEEELGKAVS